MVRAVLQVNQCALNIVFLRQNMDLRALVLFSPSSSLLLTLVHFYDKLICPWRLIWPFQENLIYLFFSTIVLYIYILY